MSNSALAVAEKPFIKASTSLALALGIEPAMMIETIKAQCFKSVTPDKVTDAQLAAYISVANALPGINPLLPGHLYAYPDRNGSITPIIGPDGIFTLLGHNKDIIAQKDGGPAWYVEHGKDGDEEICTAYINHAGKGLLSKRIYVKEWMVANNPNWQTRRRHMSEIRALKQCARQIVNAIPMDEDEYTLAGLRNVTDSALAEPTQKTPEQEKTDQEAAAAKRAKSAKRGGVVAAESTPPVDPGHIDITATTAKEEAKAVTPPPAAAKPELKADEAVTFRALEITSVRAAPTRTKAGIVPSVIAEVKGDYEGKVYHLRHGDFVDATKPETEEGNVKNINPAWSVGNKVTLILSGKKLTDGRLVAMVESINVDPKGAEDLE